MTTVGLLRGLADSDSVGFRFGDDDWTYRQLVDEASRRAALFDDLRDRGRPPFDASLDGVDTGVGADRVLRVDDADYVDRLAQMPTTVPDEPLQPDDLLLLIFTSGSTGLPKAVHCTQGRHARAGAHVARIAELAEGDTVYAPLPFFHSSSLYTGWSSAINAGVAIATRPKFSTMNTLPDSRRFGAALLAHTGKVLNYIMATPERPDDPDNPLRLALGDEASIRDIREFARRFGCHVRDSYGSTEGRPLDDADRARLDLLLA